ncbi:hypothetical protein O6H91_03G025100 [Diphasiastrum complanatum]|uniref:Uncharacterized protein n=5 Tax=Diphasiastrum complanatum TaxID=34168 RepID=A0ACC2E4Q7_DIPCM|nr:hypothetical protein O6H91_03G025100 [Diphasiastrum complanatum]KAJ7561351.1 hypothetical protein O6H91_03G025100 [Diphasiastrum complanatum]KAJ7561352.1 hypothetical protein O6H91_03G025100 [Diphasiastrum complanatum]KAJ7561356.1 hypothetical protein O6H91_03G025100 [Diphasiastrum complanatum]KAJ7561357.1 hypothetical protein O6H91_03G025100 [Diphasiastrum complanatum]
MEFQDRRRDALGNFHILSDEIICRILGMLEPRAVGFLACASSVFYVFCNEEPLWMQLCLEAHEGPLLYKEFWKQTTLEKLHLVESAAASCKSFPCCAGFNSLFLYRRWYRCHMHLESFILDNGQIDRREGMMTEEFKATYDGRKPVLLTDQTEGWLSRHSWNLEELVEKYGDVLFKVSQPHGKGISMSLKNYAAYMIMQHDEEPLYIFDSKFGEAAPGLLQDYIVPSLFNEDLLAVLDKSKRPPYRWLVLGPPRSGASWHVDPGLTSAWNALLTGRKRWALYPPGRVPPAVVVHIDEEDGDVHFEGPTSLQWWMDVYPFLKDEDKPLECTQFPGEIIFVPSGWWHCVLNLDNSIAVTQNFVNTTNLELVCLDMAPGYRHRGITRAGPLALQKGYMSTEYQGITQDWIYDVKALTMHAKSYLTSQMHENKYLGQAELRGWLRILWTSRPDLRQQIWRSACFSLDAGTWLETVTSICHAHGLPLPVNEEKLPVGHGSNMIYIVGDYAIKIYLNKYTEDEALKEMSSEVLFQIQMNQSGSPLRNFVPTMVAAGVICHSTEGYKDVPLYSHMTYAALSVKKQVDKLNMEESQHMAGPLILGADWSQDIFSAKGRAQNVPHVEGCTGRMDEQVWPYIVTKNCKGEDLADCRSKMTKDDFCNLATFLGRQVRYLHSLPLPFSFESSVYERIADSNLLAEIFRNTIKPEGRQAQIESQRFCESNGKCHPKDYTDWASKVSTVWDNFFAPIRKLRRDVKDRVNAWDSMPHHLLDQVEAYLPLDPIGLIGKEELLEGVPKANCLPVWLHMDLMDDNIKLEPYSCQIASFDLDEPTKGNEGPTLSQFTSCFENATKVTNCQRVMQPSCILDFGDISLGDAIYDFVILYIDVFKGDEELFKLFLKSYELTLSKDEIEPTKSLSNEASDKAVTNCMCPSYRAMCYCLLYKYDAMGAIFELRPELKTVSSLKELEEKFWGPLNQFSDPAVSQSSL